MSDLLNLADRVEASTGADRELDAFIHAAAHGAQAEWQEYRKDYAFHKDGHWISLGTVPDYLGSLDAAMTLVPEGWTFANLSQSDSKGWWCELRHGYLTSYDKVALGRQLENASPARALTAASLRAIHARGCADGEEA